MEQQWFKNYQSEILSDKFLSQYTNKIPKWGFNGLGYIVYKRTYARKKDNDLTEEWQETIARCINGAQKIGAKYTKQEAERLYDLIFNLKCNFAGRMLWQLGTSTVDRFGGNSLLNCWTTKISNLEDFCFLFENLMLGGGVGFSIRREDVHELPRIKTGVNIEHKNTKDADFIVPDSREGWIELLRKILTSFFITGKSFSYSTFLVRGSGEKISGFGGTASGPLILIEGIKNICNVLKERENKKLRSVDALDICNIIGSIVVAGNVRRSAEIALGDPDDFLFINAKRWDLGKIPNWRAMSNNTIYADDFSHISEKIWEGYSGNGEPYGFFNLPLSQKYGRIGEEIKDNCIALNPCQPKWAKVLTKQGIRELKEINIGDEIWSESGWTKVINKWSTGTKNVYEYRTTAGCFYGTENHKLISNGNKIQAKECESIDILTGPSSYEEIKLSIEDIMDGLIIGDGSVHEASNNLVHLCIGENDSDYFNSEISSLILKHRPGLHDYAYEVKTSISSHELLKTYNRIIPDRFYYGNKSKVCGFLRGLYSANGSICGNRVTLKSSSFKLIEQVQTMLSSIGIKSYYTTNKPSLVKFSNGEYLCKESYDLNISTDKALFCKLIGFIQNYKIEKLIKLISEVSQRVGKSNYEIIEISNISNEEVFDITVDNDSHTYWTQGCNVSNCGEIVLSDKECCNLAELYLNNIETEEELIDCSKLLYKTQKAVSSLKFLHEDTNKIVHKNMRLGLGVTGICQSFHKLDWLSNCYKELRKFDKEWSKEMGWNPSIKLTTCKPSGTVSILAGSTPGIHPGFSRYFIRRIRMSSNDPLVEECRKLGYHIEFLLDFDKSIKRDTVIVEFPCFFDEKTIIAEQMTAIEQLELVKKLQTIWADNAVSVTVYYKKEELPLIKEWLKNNYEKNIKSISFLLHSDHGFIQSPYEEITKEKYLEKIKELKSISNISINNSELIDVGECSGGSCPIR